MFLESIINWIPIHLLISAVDDVWVLYTSHLQASIPISKLFLRELLSITNATVPITCHGSFDLITYGLTEDPLINEQFQTSKDYVSLTAL